MKEIQMRVSACQLNVKWAAVEENLRHLQEWLRKHACETDIVVLPEMFATGFCVENITKYANESEKILSKIEEWCRVFSIAIAGSLMCAEKGEYFNRGFFVNESGERYFYDKRHLFRMGGEADVLSFGNSRTIVAYKGWKILLQICYDLRFPVFSRNRNNEYDLAIYVACWPMSRIQAWKTLLPARAIENLSYVCGVNAAGVDLKGRKQGGNSMFVDMKGYTIASLDENEGFVTAVLDYAALQSFRQKFAAWKDADEFEIRL